MIKKFLLFQLIVLLMTGCQEADYVKPSSTDGSHRISIAMSLRDDDNSSTIASMNDFKALLDDETFYIEDRTSNNSLKKQVQDIEGFIANAPEYLIIEPVKYYGLGESIGKASASGIKVIIVGGDVRVEDPSHVHAQYIIDCDEQGRLASQQFAQYFKEKEGLIIELQGQLGRGETRDLARGFRKGLTEYDNLDILSVYEDSDGRVKAYNDLRDALREHGDKISAIFAHSDAIGLGAYDALKESELSVENIPIISIGGSRDAMKAIITRQYYATIHYEDPFMAVGNRILSEYQGSVYDRETLLNKVVLMDNVGYFLGGQDE